MYRVDPESGIVMLLMIQLLPSTADIGQKFPTLVHQAFVDPAKAGRRPQTDH
jgi:hypothetical protein